MKRFETASSHKLKKSTSCTPSLILQITGQEEILDNVPVIQESIRLRNPYVDPLSYMQVQLLTELRALRDNGEATIQTAARSAAYNQRNCSRTSEHGLIR